MVKILIIFILILIILSLLITTVSSKEPNKGLEVGNHYFTATWCGPCRTQTPIIKRLQKEGFNIKIYDNDDRVKIVPTIIIVRKNRLLKLEGLQTYEKLKKVMIKKKIYKLW